MTDQAWIDKGLERVARIVDHLEGWESILVVLREEGLLEVLEAGQAMAGVLVDRMRINPSRAVEARERWDAAKAKLLGGKG